MNRLRVFIVLPDGYITEKERMKVRRHVTRKVIRLVGKDVDFIYHYSPQGSWPLLDLCNAIINMAEADVVYFCKGCGCNRDTKALMEVAQIYPLYTFYGILED